MFSVAEPNGAISLRRGPVCPVHDDMKITILETSPGRWRLRAEMERDEAGKRQFRYYRVVGSRLDAEQRRVELLREHAGGGEETSGRQRRLRGSLGTTLREYLTRWVARRELRNEISEQTAEWYTTMLNYVLPALGEKRLREITPQDVQTVYDTLLSNGLSARTVRHVHARLATAFEDATLEGVLDVNPLSGRKVRPPKADEQKTATLSVEQAREFARCCEMRHPAVAPIVRFALATGMRRGEICALTFEDVEIKPGADGQPASALIHVRQSLAQQGKSVAVKRPKSRAGTRTIAVHATTAAELAKLWADAQAAGRPRSSPVFQAAHGGMRSPAALTQQVNKALADCGLSQFTLHDLRHAHATYLLRNRMPVKAVSQRLGHADTTITLRTYAHVIPEDDAALALLAGNLLPPTEAGEGAAEPPIGAPEARNDHPDNEGGEE